MCTFAHALVGSRHLGCAECECARTHAYQFEFRNKPQLNIDLWTDNECFFTADEIHAFDLSTSNALIVIQYYSDDIEIQVSNWFSYFIFLVKEKHIFI